MRACGPARTDSVLLRAQVFEEVGRVRGGHGKPLGIRGAGLTGRLGHLFGCRTVPSLFRSDLLYAAFRTAAPRFVWHGFLLSQGGRGPRLPDTYSGSPVTGLSGLSNWASSVDPVRAVVEAAPPATIWATSSK